MENEKKTGGISVKTEHIFPIIKKWMYSEKEIFLRELVSNAADAVTKHRRLVSLGEAEEAPDAYRIDVRWNKSEKTLTVSDNGIGMDAAEVEKYICNMALSGALEFIEKYEGKGEGAGDGIIGHFGLGFYSAFMVADRVELLTRSYTGAPAVHWDCTEDGAYTIENAEKDGQGTDVILHINEENAEYLSREKLAEVLDRYCAFIPVEIYLTDEEAAPAEEEKKDGEEGKESEEKPINDVNPLWQRPAAECREEEYTEFYRRVFHDYREPLFHLHLRADYPLNFKGVLFFPKIAENYENPEGQIKLYYNQVFVADNIKEIIPPYLLMLRGVVDCPELPLNVSRSYLQNSAYVSKVSAYIVKKVADKLAGMIREDRAKYETLWPDIATFTEYACIHDKKFYDRVREAILFPLTGNVKKTLPEMLEAAKEEGHEKIFYYATDEKQQAAYIELLEKRGYSVCLAHNMVETRFLQSAETYEAGLRCLRVDAAGDALAKEADADAEKRAQEIFGGMSAEGLKITVKCEKYEDASFPALFHIGEEESRMREMMRLYAPEGAPIPVEATLSLNTANPVIARLLSGGYAEEEKDVAAQVFRLALLSCRPLDANEMKEFLRASYAMLERFHA